MVDIEQLTPGHSKRADNFCKAALNAIRETQAQHPQLYFCQITNHLVERGNTLYRLAQKSRPNKRKKLHIKIHELDIASVGYTQILLQASSGLEAPLLLLMTQIDELAQNVYYPVTIGRGELEISKNMGRTFFSHICDYTFYDR